jgi:hypothetical protein
VCDERLSWLVEIYRLLYTSFIGIIIPSLMAESA